MNSDDTNSKPRSPATIVTHYGRDPEKQYGFVNPPIVRGSTVIFQSYDQLKGHKRPYGYGRHGNPTNDAVQSTVTELENGAQTFLAPSGVSAITTALMAVLKTGDDLLVCDTVYEPTRQFCDSILEKMGVTTRYYDPTIGVGIEKLIQPNTKAVMVESPGSLTFEVQDIPAIASVCGPKEIAIIADNSWASPLYYKPLDLGANIVVHAGTKMFSGHSDIMFGTITTDATYEKRVQNTYRALGVCVGPDDSYLIARGLRSLELRMREQGQKALEMAKWLEKHPLVETVLHPALPQHPQHDIYQRDFTGPGALFSLILKPAGEEAVAAMVDDMELFAMGYSWGGFESLILPVKISSQRSVTQWPHDGNLIRLNIGLEGIEDLQADLSAGFERYRQMANIKLD
ncbi:cystathionine beta-lyase [Maritalea mediterranea]|uniref:Cystathionine beta-lyase n=1 Tax=Maritalea mediterranea TaxID=2909667 RepID=A0ABS9E5V4_9HYPH|nr:cystathionine beta-lyase [Maritalea mediterranea]MCF4098247.1 cystathionine beta-lyase [Maritalea mediterranea]